MVSDTFSEENISEHQDTFTNWLIINKDVKMVGCLHATASCLLQTSSSSVSWSEQKFNLVILTELWCLCVNRLLSSLHVNVPWEKCGVSVRASERFFKSNSREDTWQTHVHTEVIHGSTAGEIFFVNPEFKTLGKKPRLLFLHLFVYLCGWLSICLCMNIVYKYCL